MPIIENLKSVAKKQQQQQQKKPEQTKKAKKIGRVGSYGDRVTQKHTNIHTQSLYLLNVVFVELVVVAVFDVRHLLLHVRYGGQVQCCTGHSLHPLLELRLCEILIGHKLQSVHPLRCAMSETSQV